MIETTTSSAAIRSTIAHAARILASAGLFGIDGTVAVRDGESMWVTGGEVHGAAVRARDVVRVALGDETTEHHLFREIFVRRPDAGAIVSSAPEYVVTLSVAGRPLVPVNSIGSFLLETTPLFEDQAPITTAARAAALAQRLGAGPAIVLRGRGLVIVAPNLETAVAWTTSAEENARHCYNAALLGEPATLRGAELQAVARENWTPVIVRKHWNYQAETARKAGALEGIDE